VKTRAALLTGTGEKWAIEEIDLASPGPDEVLVEMKAAGLCHSDEHMVTGDMVTPEPVRLELGLPSQFPLVGGHEGAGVVVEVGSQVTGLAVGDHVATSFMPACGTCPPCVSGRQYLCDQGFSLLQKDKEPRHLWRGEPVNIFSGVGSFAEHALVHKNSLVKVQEQMPFAAVALVSCGVATGWGSAVERAGTRPGDVVAVVGVGGIGMNAVQGAACAGARAIVAIDPVALKREKALDFGATHAAASIQEARPIIEQVSLGRLADRVILAPSVLYGDLLGEALSITGKGSTCVATAVAPITQTTASISLFELTLWNKELKGTVFGSVNPRVELPRLLALYESGKLKLDELISRRYALDEINLGYDDQRQGRILRGVIEF
jgi:S-(hydroxymethyl)glutathione dehydrogenase/alcohol dehydrogenase